MKILQVIPHYFPSPHFGGTPVSCHFLSRELTNLGEEVHVLTTDAFSKDKRYKAQNLPEVYDNYQIFRFTNLSNTLAYRNRFSIPLPSLSFLFGKLDRYDIIQLHEYRNLLNVLLCLLKPFTKAKYVLYPLGTYPVFNTQITFKKFFDLLFSKIINLAIDKYVVVSEMEKKSLIDCGVMRNKIKVIYYGIDVVGSGRKYRSIYSYTYILYLGRIDKRKGVDILIKAYGFSEIYRKNIHLVIAGNDSNFQKECIDLVKTLKLGKFVHFVGPVQGEQKESLLNNAKLVSYVTDNEAYGLVPVEAVLSGVYPVVAKGAGVGEILGREGLCYEVEYGDVEGLGRILRTRSDVERVVPKTKIQKLVKLYSWRSVSERFITLYQDVKKN